MMSESMPTPSRELAPDVHKKETETYLVVKPRLGTQKVTNDFIICDIIEGVIFTP